MLRRSAIQKGRTFQKTICDRLKAVFGFTDDDIRTPVGCETGADIKLMSAHSRAVLPYSFELKNVEKLNFWQAFEQAKGHGALTPVLIAKKNHTKPLVVMDFEDWMKMVEALNTQSAPTTEQPDDESSTTI